MNIFPGWSLNNPIAVFLIFVVMVSVLGVRVKMLDTSRCLKMATANYGKENKESYNSFKNNFKKQEQNKPNITTSFLIISSQHNQFFSYETLFASCFVDISRQIDPVLIDLDRN